jgi:hypothetical protein
MTPREASIEIELIMETLMDIGVLPGQERLVAQIFGSLGRLQDQFISPMRKQANQPLHPPSWPHVPPRRERAQTIIGIGQSNGRLE